MDKKRFLTLCEVAKILNLSNPRIYQMDDELKPVFVARGRKMKTRMYDPEVVAEVAAARESAPDYPEVLRALWRAQSIKWRRAGEVNPLTITSFVAISLQQCHWCGTLPLSRRIGDHIVTANGIDVLDEAKGLSRDNVITCCYRCEALREFMSGDELVAYATTVVEWHERGGKYGRSLKWLF